ncbi:GntR family transcriptional regulator [Antrihabitans sp. YC2-6]|uniref:GntR family transcriptional regulator n=1 Tax=Antrihabitans sp. YC2-6 TaxID=2799498 RepID=UPI0018F3D211|nr:GntR family transcriptional regulator [Antrihabitans sp. YC2-6]MBJ8347795.1 GntR family transcriptional regulator [Antrihabitans sp. YC2-6]
MGRRGLFRDSSLRERVYRSIREDLASGVIAPTERLGEERLAELYGVSRTPVREALARLLSDGLIERDEHGLYPYRPRLEELDGLYELRVTLEARGIRRVLENAELQHDSEALTAELTTWQGFRELPPLPDAELVAVDEQFHTTLLQASGNSALAEALAVVNTRMRPVRALDALTPDRVATMVAEHITIVESLLAGRLESALEQLVAHIESSQVRVLERAERAMSMSKLGLALRG